MAGHLDSSFAGGYVTNDVSPGWDWGEAVAVQPDGKIVVAGRFNGDGQYSSWDAGVMRFTATGSLDTSFANGGKLVLNPDNGWDEAKAVLVQPDGKLVVAGGFSPDRTQPYGQGFVMRLLPDGRLDPAFAAGGMVALPLGTWLLDAVRTPGGEIVVSGWYDGKTLVARLRSDGSLDPSFGQSGIATFDSPGFGGDVLVLQSDGGLVVACNESNPYWSAALAVRFTASGALDPTFGTNGLLRTSVGTDTRPRRANIRDGVVDAMGRIVLVGTAWLDEDYSPFVSPGLPVMDSDPPRKRYINRDTVLLRLLPDGSLDTSLAGVGKLVVPIPQTVPDARPPGLAWNESGTVQRETDAAALAIDPQGRLLVAGAVGQPEFAAAVMRFTEAGLLDPTFGVAGVSAVAHPRTDKPSASFFTDIALLPDGRVVTAGRMYDSTKDAVVVARFLPGNATTSVWSWGWNGVGQLGDGTKVDHHSPVPTQGLSGVVTVSAGAHHTLALKGDGTVWAWGWNALGQLGDGTLLDRSSPVRVPGLDGVIAVSAGYFHSLALKGDGTVWAWGWNAVGQLGDGTVVDRPSPVRVTRLTNVSSIAGGGLHSVAARDDGTIWTWGWNGVTELGDQTTETRLEPVPSLINADSFSWTSSVLAGAFDSLAVDSRTGGVSWGWNWGATPGGDPNPLANVRLDFQVLRSAGGGYHNLALKDNGDVLAIGNNSLGQLGDGSGTNAAWFRLVPGIKATEIAAGAVHSLAIMGDGTVRAWGWNAAGQLGNGFTLDSPRPVPVFALANVTGISAGYLHSVAVRVG
jgi:uncharacterized delta-60 repeat protein